MFKNNSIHSPKLSRSGWSPIENFQIPLIKYLPTVIYLNRLLND